MQLDEVLELFESLKINIPVTLLFVLPFIMVISPVNGVQSFAVYRVNQYDVGGTYYGTRSTLVNMDARPVDATVLSRKCVVTRITELTLERFRTLTDQNVGAIFILLPVNLSALSDEHKKELVELEKVFLTEEILFPVYFAVEDEEVARIYDGIKTSSYVDGVATATDALLQSMSANGFQFNVNTNQAKRLDKYKTYNLHGVLEGHGNSEKLPTVLFVAHHDSLGAVPSLSFGADSNGSGVAALLELMRLFARMYSSPSSRADFNIAFLLSGAAKFNYFGTKKWLEETKESDRFPSLSNVALVLCLDTIGLSGNLNVHVSKPPKEGSPAAAILRNLEEVAASQGLSVNLIHKKINLGDPQLAWEHEQFALNKLYGMTLSGLDSHKDSRRTSILDTRSAVDSQGLTINTDMIGEAVSRYLFSASLENSTLSNLKVLSNELAVQKTMLDAWLNLLTSDPRAAQLIDGKHPIFVSIEQAFRRHLRSVQATAYECDKREPEFVLYDTVEEVAHVYNVKPAVFDLVLAIAIAAYLGVLYLCSLGFPNLLSALLRKSKKL